MVDGGCGRWMKGGQHPYPSSTPQECLFWTKRVAHGDLREGAQEQHLGFIREDEEVLDGDGEMPLSCRSSSLATSLAYALLSFTK